MNQYEYINKFKYLGSIIILIYHATGLFGITDTFGGVFGAYGWIPVEFFFWISGFFMQKLYWLRINRKEIRLRDYFYKKVKKIYPLYAASSILGWIIAVTIEKKMITLWDFAVNVFMINTGYYYINNDWRNALGNVTWYIGVLMTCYFLFYYISKWIADEENLIFVYSISCIIASIGLMFWDAPFFNFYMLRGILGFSAGAIFLILSKDMRNMNINRKLKISSLIILLLWGAYTMYEHLLGNARLIILLDVMLIPSFIYIIENIQWLKTFLNTKSKRILFDELSSYIYFLHYPVGYLYVNICRKFGILTNNWSMCIIYIILINIISIVLIRIKNRINQRRYLF